MSATRYDPKLPPLGHVVLIAALFLTVMYVWRGLSDEWTTPTIYETTPVAYTPHVGAQLGNLSSRNHVSVSTPALLAEYDLRGGSLFVELPSAGVVWETTTKTSVWYSLLPSNGGTPWISQEIILLPSQPHPGWVLERLIPNTSKITLAVTYHSPDNRVGIALWVCAFASVLISFLVACFFLLDKLMRQRRKLVYDYGSDECK